jgi:hypothetical protein
LSGKRSYSRYASHPAVAWQSFCHSNFLTLPHYRIRHKGNRGNYTARCISDYDTFRLYAASVRRGRNFSHVKCWRFKTERVRAKIFSVREYFMWSQTNVSEGLIFVLLTLTCFLDTHIKKSCSHCGDTTRKVCAISVCAAHSLSFCESVKLILQNSISLLLLHLMRKWKTFFSSSSCLPLTRCSKNSEIVQKSEKGETFLRNAFLLCFYESE